jgi:DNA-binding response OmpR family regulator
MTKKVLVVDDERKIVDIVKAYLERDGFSVTTAYNGRSALEEVRRNSPDIIILDLMLPEISGWDVCRSLRKESDVPVIMLTARDEATEKIVGLEIGADDYVTKPFDPKELVARVKAVLRRSENKVLHDKVVRVANLEINIEKRRVVAKSGDIIELTPFEFDLLKIMAEHPGRVYSRMQLLDKVQGEAYEAYERTVDTHIKNLRRKIEPNPEKPSYIITVYGVGYKIEGD